MASGNAGTPPLLQQFTVKGYKNLTQAVTFGPLGRINVVHGENNVGKSNLLQALDLFLRSLSFVKSKESVLSSADEFARIGHPVNEIFNLSQPAPIEMTGVFWITRARQERAGGTFLPSATERVEVSVKLKRERRGVSHQTTKFAFESKQVGIHEVDVRRFLSTPFPFQDEESASRFALLGVNRRLMVEDTTPPSLYIVPQKLRDALFDAKESREGALVQRWELFVETMKQFEHILGPGQFATAFDRQNNQADLVLDRGNVRVPVDWLGSGVQQIVALLGQLLMTPATLVGIEEPELNLRYTLQKQLLKALQQIAASEYGPEQIFLSSHSPAFEAEEHFFGMEMGDEGPTLSRRPRAMARIYTGTRDEEDLYPEMLAQKPEPPCYVSSEGLVMLPQDVRRALKIEGGGGVSFIPNKESGRLEIWTTDELEQWWVGGNDRDADE